MTREEIKSCVRKTIDDCLVEVLARRPAVHVADHQYRQMEQLVDELAQLFYDIRLQNLNL